MKKKILLLCALCCAVMLSVAAGTSMVGFAATSSGNITFTKESSIDMTQTNWHYVQFGKEMEVYDATDGWKWEEKYEANEDGEGDLYREVLSCIDANSSARTITWKVDLPVSAANLYISIAMAPNQVDPKAHQSQVWVSANNEDWTLMTVSLPSDGWQGGFALFDASADLNALFNPAEPETPDVPETPDEPAAQADETVRSVYIKVGTNQHEAHGYRIRGRFVISHDAKLYKETVDTASLGLGSVYATTTRGFEGLEDSAYLVYSKGGNTGSSRYYDGTSFNACEPFDGSGDNRMDKIGRAHGIYKYTTSSGVKGLVMKASIAGHGLLQIYTGDKDLTQANADLADSITFRQQFDEITASAINLADWKTLTATGGNHTIDLSDYITPSTAQTLFFRVSDASDLNGAGGNVLGMRWVEYLDLTAESAINLTETEGEVDANAQLDLVQYIGTPTLDFKGDYEGTIDYTYTYEVTSANKANATVTADGKFTATAAGEYDVKITLHASNTEATDYDTFTVTVKAITTPDPGPGEDDPNKPGEDDPNNPGTDPGTNPGGTTDPGEKEPSENKDGKKGCGGELTATASAAGVIIVLAVAALCAVSRKKKSELK